MGREYSSSKGPHKTENEEGVQDSTMLLDPSKKKVSGVANDQPYAEHRSCSFKSDALIRPTIALTSQLIVLALLIMFLIWTECTSHAIVPTRMASFYVKHPQTGTTVITLIGTFLSLSGTKAFAEAVRFSTVVSLLNTHGPKNMSLYTLYARTTVGSGGPLFHFDRTRVHWTIISLIVLLLFTVQTTAWTTLLTPRQNDIPQQNYFTDLNYPDLLGVNLDFSSNRLQVWEGASDCGTAVIKNRFGAAFYTSFMEYVINNSSTFGVLPTNIPGVHDVDWTRVEATQQGLTADVSCMNTPDSDPDIRVNKTIMADGIMKISSCCNCTHGAGSPIYVLPQANPQEWNYLTFAVCPISNTDDIITVYINGGGILPFVDDENLTTIHVWNQTCTIKPQWIQVNATYVSDDMFVTLEPISELPDIPLNSSTIIQAAIEALKVHFSSSQSITGNSISTVIYSQQWELSTYGEASVFMANYIRGVFEFGATIPRLLISRFESHPLPLEVEDSLSPYLQQFQMTIFVNAFVWGQESRLGLVLVISPLAIMIATILIILKSFRKVQKQGHVDLDKVASFNAKDILHIIAACCSEDAHTKLFPDYTKVDSFSKDVGVKLAWGEVGSGATGFHFEL